MEANRWCTGVPTRAQDASSDGDEHHLTYTEMSASLALLSGLLGPDQRNQIAVSVVETISGSPENQLLLADLVPHLSSETINEILPRVVECVKEVAKSAKTAEYDSAARLLCLSAQFTTEFSAWAESQLMRSSFVSSRVGSDQPSQPDLDEISIDLISCILQFLQRLYTQTDLHELAFTLRIDRILCVLLSHVEPSVSSESYNLLRWRVDAIVKQCNASDAACEFFWSLIFPSHLRELSEGPGYAMWLRFLNSPLSSFKSNAYFQEHFISTASYWELLQKGLTRSSHDIRKFCLSILQLSLKAINVRLSLPLIQWNPSCEAQLLKEWSRYTTLYELVGIDTSLHQMQGAVNDLVAMISDDSHIHASWGFALLSTGFKASIDSVRKFSTSVLLSIKPAELHLLKYGLLYLTNDFLPYMMHARHFAVRKSPTGPTCEYGEQLSGFICSILQSLESDEDISTVSHSVMSVLLENSESFEGVRVFVAHGLVRGLKAKKALKHSTHFNCLSSLFECPAEGALYKKVLQTLFFQLLMNFEADSFANQIRRIRAFVVINGPDVLFEHKGPAIEYISLLDNWDAEASRFLASDASEDEKAIAAWVMFNSRIDPDALLQTKSLTLKCKLWGILQKLPDNFLTQTKSEILESSVRGPDAAEICKILTLPSFPALSGIEYDLSGLLGSVFYLTQETQDFKDLQLAVSQLRLINRLIESGHFCPFPIEGVLQLFHSSRDSINRMPKSIPGFYKVADDLLGEIHRLLLLTLEDEISGHTLDLIIPFLSFESIHYVTVCAIANITQHYVEQSSLTSRYRFLLLHNLFSSVEELDADRFRLLQKKLHLQLFEIFLHESVLLDAVTDSLMADLIDRFCFLMITASSGRRGFMPTMMRCLLDFQLTHLSAFERLSFLPEVLVRATIHRDLQSNAYKLEPIVGALYDARLAPSPDSHIYKEVYGVKEVAYQVWLLTILSSIQSSPCAEAILDSVLDSSDSFGLFNISKPTDGDGEYTRLQLAKVVISVIDKVNKGKKKLRYFETFISIVEKDPSPLVRVYFEWAIAIELSQNSALFESIFAKLEQAIESNSAKPTTVTTYERVLFLAIRAMELTHKTKQLSRFIALLIPAAATNKAITRHFSMSLAISVYDEIHTKSLPVDPQLVSVIDNMYKGALATEGFGQFRSGDANLWDIIADYDLYHISGGLLKKVSDRDIELIDRGIFRSYLSETQCALLTRPVGYEEKNVWMRDLKELTLSQKLKESSEILASPLQTKSGAWSSIMEIDESARNTEIARSELIVVASLVDMPPNLGGICRLCDVLGAGLLTLGDIRVKNQQQFKSVAVTADYWMPMTEVKPEHLAQFIREKKAAGYTLVGLEQTDKSVVLDSNLKFPKKSLIILGREKEGVPGELLAELDFCVEIKQSGVVRSMNIQTAAAVIVHAYSMQHC